MTGIRDHLRRRFDNQRVVFWHDPKSQYAAELDSLDLPDVVTVRVANDEFAIKYRLLHEQPNDKFIIYRCGQSPSGTENWLLDLELAYGIFTAERSALIAEDLGLTNIGMDEVVQEQEKFFNSGKRVESLKALLAPEDGADHLRAKMCAVTLGQKAHSLLEITRTLLMENAGGRRTKFDALTDFGLDAFFWRGVASIYGYESDTPTIDDFILWTFRKAIDGFQSDRAGGLQHLQLDFASLRNDRRSHDALLSLAKRASIDLNYRVSIEDASFRDLLETDLFPETDQRITADLARAVAEQTVTARDVAEVVRTRQRSIWIDDFRERYIAIDAAAELLSALTTIDLAVASFDEALERYRSDWFRIDQLYRQFTHAYRGIEGEHPLAALRDLVEKRYTNKFVYVLANAFQQQIDQAGQWTSGTLGSQRSFFRTYLEQLLADGKKAVVIISDALRYEVAEELGSRIRQENRFDATLEAMLGVLPSYTQLGMAALLPHRSLTHSTDGKTVLADGEPTNGTAARNKILQGVGGTAIQAEDFRSLNAEERRELFKSNQVLYIYHNVIDAIGDKLNSERRVFEAAEQTLSELVDLVKKSASANATHMFVTADHGFLFQDEELPPQFFLSEQPQGDTLLVTNRRYVLGHGLKDSAAFTKFDAADLHLDGEIEVLIPKSLQRLRLPGGGSRFVHGGATLQEIVVPVLTITKKRKSDVRPVNVQILPETDKITTSQMVVRMFQSEPVSDKVQARVMRAGIYVGETLLSNDPPPEITFDSTSDDQRDRYQSVQLLLNQTANDFDNRQVEFRLEERIPNTNQWRVRERAMYLLKRSFTPDFDF